MGVHVDGDADTSVGFVTMQGEPRTFREGRRVSRYFDLSVKDDTSAVIGAGY